VIAQSNLAFVFAGQGDWVEAEKHYTEAVRIQPGNQTERLNLAIARAKLGQTDAALREISHVQSASNHSILAKIFLEQGKLNEAAAQYSAAVRLDPADASARESLGLALAQQGKTAEASAQFAALVQLRPDAQAHYYLALSLLTEAKAKLAAQHYRETIRLKH